MSGQTLGSVISTSLFAYGLMAAIALATAVFISLLVAGLAALGRRNEASAAAVAPPAAVAHQPAPAPTKGIDPTIVAVITAAIESVVGAHRIVYIGETQAMGGWIGEVRQRHHGSHNPHHDH